MVILKVLMCSIYIMFESVDDVNVCPRTNSTSGFTRLPLANLDSLYQNNIYNVIF